MRDQKEQADQKALGEKQKKFNEFRFVMDFAASLYSKIDPKDLDADFESIANNCFKAADAFYKVTHEEQVKRVGE
jgi:hypothetical protein